MFGFVTDELFELRKGPQRQGFDEIINESILAIQSYLFRRKFKAELHLSAEILLDFFLHQKVRSFSLVEVYLNRTVELNFVHHELKPLLFDEFRGENIAKKLPLLLHQPNFIEAGDEEIEVDAVILLADVVAEMREDELKTIEQNSQSETALLFACIFKCLNYLSAHYLEIIQRLKY